MTTTSQTSPSPTHLFLRKFGNAAIISDGSPRQYSFVTKRYLDIWRQSVRCDVRDWFMTQQLIKVCLMILYHRKGVFNLA